MQQKPDQLIAEACRMMVKQIIDNDVESLSSLINKYPKMAISNIFSINGEAGSFSPCRLILPTQNLNLMQVAAISDSLECFVYLEQNTSLEINSLSADSLRPIHYACARNSLEIVSYILTDHPEEARIITPYYYSLFLCIVASGYMSNMVTKLLIQNKAEYPSTPKREEHYLPINRAIALKDIQNLKSLLKYHNINNKKYKSFSPIMTAVIYQKIEAVELLVQSGEDILYTTKDGQNALSIGCFLNDQCDDRNSMEEIIEILLKNTWGKSIEPPKNYISKRTGEKVEKRLSGPAQWMCRSKSRKIVRLFFKYHPEVDLSRIDQMGNTGLNIIFSGLWSVKEKVEILYLFLAHGFDINQCNPEIGQRSLLQMATSFCTEPEVIHILLNNGADMYIPYVRSREQIALGIYKKKMTVFQFIMENGKDDIKNIFIAHAAKISQPPE